MPTTTQTSPLNVLIVDDNEICARGIARMVEKEGHVAIVVTRATEALRLVPRLDIDVVIADENMPGMTGSEILGTLARLQPGCFRALISGGLDNADIVALVNQARVEFVVAKPYTVDDMQALLRTAQASLRGRAQRKKSSAAVAWSSVPRDESGAIVLAV